MQDITASIVELKRVEERRLRADEAERTPKEEVSRAVRDRQAGWLLKPQHCSCRSAARQSMLKMLLYFLTLCMTLPRHTVFWLAIGSKVHFGTLTQTM